MLWLWPKRKTRALAAFGALALALAMASCASGEKDRLPSLDAGPPPHPLEFEFAGLGLGMTKEAVVDAWGPPSFETARSVEYANRGGYANVKLLFKSVPVAENIQLEAARALGDDRPFEFLTAIVLMPAESRAKNELRTELVSLYGQPPADPVLFAPLNCRPPACEIFRPAECVLLKVAWETAAAGVERSERVASLAYILAPDALITEVPRPDWPSLRGRVAPSPPSELKARLAGLRTGDNGALIEDIVKVMGLPNLVLDDGAGRRSLYYFWLNNAFVRLNLTEGTLRSIASAKIGLSDAIIPKTRKSS